MRLKEWELKETPRQRIMRLNKQIEHFKCYGGTRLCEQPICSFCEHLRVFEYYEGGCDADCTVDAPRWKDGDDDIKHCRLFKASKYWRYEVEKLLNHVMSDIISDMCGRMTELSKRLPLEKCARLEPCQK